MTRSVKIVALAVLITSPAAAQIPDSLWTIRGGTFAGTAVHIDTYLATRRSSKFLRVSKLKGDSRFVAWNPSHLPAPVAFRPGKISADDSIAFWSIIRQMEADMGMRLFEPATITRDADPDDVIIVDTKNMAGDDGVTYVTWSNNGGLYDARVFFRSSSTFHDSRTVTHEMMHTLGFGHTSAWSSVMNSGQWAPRRLTPDDVAYAQFAFESRAESERLDMWERLALVVDREPASRDPVDSYAICPLESRTPVNDSRRWEPAVLPIGGPLRSSSCFR